MSDEELIIVGDEAWTREEWDRAGRQRPWHRLTDEERQHYKRDWNRRRRTDEVYRTEEAARERERHRVGKAGAGYRAWRVTGSLHDLGCPGPQAHLKGKVRCDRLLLVEPE